MSHVIQQSLCSADAAAVRPVGRSRDGWFEQREGGVYTLARQWPPRFDVMAQSAFPLLNSRRLARQIRQDLWRMLRDLRAFSPVIKIDARECDLMVYAGGRVEARQVAPQAISHRISELLNAPANRVRWSRWARIGGRT